MELVDMMTREVEVISPEDSLQEAATRMARRDVGGLPVCDGNRLVGMITDRDIVVRSVAYGRDPRLDRVADAMTNDVEVCFDGESLEEIGRHMQERQIRRLVVLGQAGDLVGIISLGDLARSHANAPVVTRTVEEIAEPIKMTSVQYLYPQSARA
jgi:CBS domain-containing protein